MSRKWMCGLGVLAVALALPMTQPAQAGSFAVTVSGGLSVPTGDFGDKDMLDAESGFQAGGAVDYMLNDMFAIGVDGSWLRNKHGAEGETIDLGGGDTYSLDEDKFTTYQVGAHGKYFIPAGGNIRPFLLGGLGMYNTKEKWEETTTIGGIATKNSDEEGTDSRFGGKLGLGGMFKVNEMVGVGVQGDFNFISQDKDKVGIDSIQYFAAVAAISYNFMAK